MTNLTNLKDGHWKWLSGLLNALELSPEQALSAMEYVYKTAFEHGYKHAKEAREGCNLSYLLSAEESEAQFRSGIGGNK